MAPHRDAAINRQGRAAVGQRQIVQAAVAEHHEPVPAQRLAARKADCPIRVVRRVAHITRPVQYEVADHRQARPVDGVPHVQHAVHRHPVQRPALHDEGSATGCCDAAAKYRAALQPQNIGLAVQRQCLPGVGQYTAYPQQATAALKVSQAAGRERARHGQCSDRTFNQPRIGEWLRGDDNRPVADIRRNRPLIDDRHVDRPPPGKAALRPHRSVHSPHRNAAANRQRRARARQPQRVGVEAPSIVVSKHHRPVAAQRLAARKVDRAISVVGRVAKKARPIER